jgi:hypothetical protein
MCRPKKNPVIFKWSGHEIDIKNWTKYLLKIRKGEHGKNVKTSSYPYLGLDLPMHKKIHIVNQSFKLKRYGTPTRDILQ